MSAVHRAGIWQDCGWDSLGPIRKNREKSMVAKCQICVWASNYFSSDSAEIQPDCTTNDGWWKPVAGIGNPFHAHVLSWFGRNHRVNVTKLARSCLTYGRFWAEPILSLPHARPLFFFCGILGLRWHVVPKRDRLPLDHPMHFWAHVSAMQSKKMLE